MTRSVLVGGGAVLFLLVVTAAYLMLGAGSFRRAVTVSGIYAVVRPGGYEAVCFLDADSKQGGLSCLPLDQVRKREAGKN